MNQYSNIDDEVEFRKQMRNWRPDFSEKVSVQRFSFNHTNGLSHELLPVITMEKPHDISYLIWGLIPSGIKTTAGKTELWSKGATLTAKSEEIHTNKFWKGPMQCQRCLVPATAFFALRDYKGVKYPYLVQVVNPDFPDDATSFCFAGIYDKWYEKESGAIAHTFAIITTSANELMEQIDTTPARDGGERQPVIVMPKDYNAWLSPYATFQQLELIMLPLESENIRAYTVTKNITKKGFNFRDPEFLQHVAYEELPGTSFNTGEFNAGDQMFLDL